MKKPSRQDAHDALKEDVTVVTERLRLRLASQTFSYRIGKFVLFDKNPPGEAHDALKEDCHCRDSASAPESGEPDSISYPTRKFRPMRQKTSGVYPQMPMVYMD